MLKIMSALSEQSDGSEHISRKHKKKDEYSDFTREKGDVEFNSIHKVNTTTEEEFPDKDKSRKQSRKGYDQSKLGDKTPKSVDAKFNKSGTGSAKRPADKTEGDKKIPKLRTGIA